MNQDAIDRLIGEARQLAITGIRKMATHLLQAYPEAITFVLNDGTCAIETELPTQTTSTWLYRDIETLENYVDRNRAILSDCRIVICKDELLA